MITRIFGGIHLPVRSRRAGTLAAVTVFLAVLILVAVLGHIWENDALVTDFGRKNLRPGTAYLFGTDWLGRDMLKRTAAGLSMSIRLGIVTAASSAVIAVILGTAAAVLGKAADMAVSGLIDMMMGIPHMLLLILISFAFGKGFTGVAAGIALTHWPSLARLIRAEVLQLKASQYVKISEKLGMGKWRIAVEHPHAILHEASITFLGFGLPPEEPAIGIILSESMKYLITGKWWLAVFPGAALVATVLVFQGLGQSVSSLLDPQSAHE